MSESKFVTPSPICVALDLYAADVRFTVSDRTETVVGISPSDPGKAADAKAVENTRVEYDEATRTLSIATKKPLKRFVDWSSKRPESIDVVIALPTDSELRAEADLGDFRADGALGPVRLKTGIGTVRLTETGPLTIHNGVGEITVTAVSGPTQVHSGSGEIRLGTLDGTAEVSSDNGRIRISTITGPATVKCSNGSVSVDRALSDITAASANGEVRIGEVVRGKVSATSKNGGVDVGVREGTAAWLELNTSLGRVHNELASSDAPQAGEPVDKVELRATTKIGDVTVRRAPRLDD